MKKKIAIGIVIALVLMQFIRIDKSAPEYDKSKDLLAMHPASEQVTTLLKGACYDCHSHETEYPWYTNIAPLSFWIKGHIKGGKQHLIFSDMGNLTPDKYRHEIEECIEVIEEKRMPTATYKMMHKVAQLSDEERDVLVKWFESVK